MKHKMTLVDGGPSSMHRRYTYRGHTIEQSYRPHDVRNKTHRGFVWCVLWKPDWQIQKVKMSFYRTRDLAKAAVDYRMDAPEPPAEHPDPAATATMRAAYAEMTRPERVEFCKLNDSIEVSAKGRDVLSKDVVLGLLDEIDRGSVAVSPELEAAARKATNRDDTVITYALSEVRQALFDLRTGTGRFRSDDAIAWQRIRSNIKDELIRIEGLAQRALVTTRKERQIY